MPLRSVNRISRRAIKWRPSVVLRPTNNAGLMNTAGPTNIADPYTKALGCLAFLCVCHACRSCLCASLRQAIFSHKRPHVSDPEKLAADAKLAGPAIRSVPDPGVPCLPDGAQPVGSEGGRLHGVRMAAQEAP
jgi:hypothetical protein